MKRECPIRILLVEDSLADALLVLRRLEAELGSLDSIEVERATTLEQAIEHLRRQSANLVLLDLNLPDSGGTETVRRLRVVETRVPIFVYSSGGAIRLHPRALEAGAQDFFSKGEFECGSLIDRIRSVVERPQLFEETV